MPEINRTKNRMHHHDQFAGVLNKAIDLTQSEQKQRHYILLFILGLSSYINIVAITCLPILPGGFLLRSFYQPASPIPMTMVA